VKQGLLQLFLFLFCTAPLWSYNGRVSHVYFEQNQNGQIIKNSFAEPHGLKLIETSNHSHFFIDANNPLFHIYGHIGGYNITLLHLLALGLSLLLQFLSFKKINRIIAESKFFKRWSMRFLKLTLWGLLLIGNIGVLLGIDYYQTQIHFRYHQIPVFKNQTIQAVQKGLHNPMWFEKQATTQLSVQLYIKTAGKWHTQRENAVLYFTKDGQNTPLKFSHSSRYLNLREKGKLQQLFRARTQYFVIESPDSSGRIQQEIYLPNGQKVNLLANGKNDPPKRILLFVNGYRPVSASKDLEKVKDQILQKGLEHPDSKNLIYSSDTYDYWQNNAEMVKNFEARIEPDLILYADGHHSIQTSNHLNLLNFASKAALYPKPCIGKKHRCYTTQVADQTSIRTYDLLAIKSNTQGFLTRFKAGKIAALNLLQEISSLGDYSKNDTLYVVSHSMGHAYFCGMASVLKKHLQFANYYALAPENANAKCFVQKNWRAVFQYGTILYGKRKHAPCQQDGVAPQVKMSGISKAQQIGFPTAFTTKLGYFSAHYVGYFDWIFKIKPKEPGYVSNY
jgi:hypothetical protein